jgi:Nif-specific regulatory protein
VREANVVPEMIGVSEPMRRMGGQVQRFARSAGASVLIRGESGSGKELVARALHSLSPRADEPFVAVNCAAIPDGMLESELFGHVKGAFTGAVKDHRGKFALAHGGTLFLDEIGDLSLPAQAKLLRALEEGEVQPLGAEAVTRVDVRVLSATHRDLERSFFRANRGNDRTSQRLID